MNQMINELAVAAVTGHYKFNNTRFVFCKKNQTQYANKSVINSNCDC